MKICLPEYFTGIRLSCHCFELIIGGFILRNLKDGGDVSES